MSLLRSPGHISPAETDDLLDIAWKDSLNFKKIGGLNTCFLFPFAILELKLAFKSDGSMSKENLLIPSWFQALVDDNLLIMMDKFSKYLTGCALSHSYP
jgi:SPX domain protein involved in polyphosphate accumulation